MTEETVTETTTRPDAPGADDSLSGDAADKTDDAPAAVVDEQDAEGETKQGQEAPDAEAQPGAAEDLKVVVSIKGGRATIGVQQPSSDPYIETFDDHDLSTLAQEVGVVTERARARWEETPKHPAYARPASPARRRNRRQQGEAEREQAQTPRLF